MSDLWPEVRGMADTDGWTPIADLPPITVAEIMGEPEPWQHPKRTDWIARQRTEALIRERNRRVDAQDALNRLLRAVEAHRVAVPPRNARKADRTLWETLEAIGGDDG